MKKAERKWNNNLTFWQESWTNCCGGCRIVVLRLFATSVSRLIETLLTILSSLILLRHNTRCPKVDHASMVLQTVKRCVEHFQLLQMRVALEEPSRLHEISVRQLIKLLPPPFHYGYVLGGGKILRKFRTYDNLLIRKHKLFSGNCIW